MPLGKTEIRNRWGFHPATPETAPQHEAVREAFVALAEFLDTLLPDGRAKSLVWTNLQNASMWANFCVAEQAPVEMDLPTPPKPAASPVSKIRPSVPRVGA